MNGVSPDFLRNLDLNLQGQEFEMSASRKRGESYRKMRKINFINFFNLSIEIHYFEYWTL